jgi:ABC-type transporter Mla subunit MlaD
VSLIGDIFDLITNLSGVLDQIDSVIHNGSALVFNVKTEIDKIKAFKFDPKWKTRVINAPAAITQTKKLVVDLNEQIHTALNNLFSNLRAIAAARTRHKIEGGGHGVEGILSLVTDVRNFVNEVDIGIKSLDSFVDALRQITEELSGLESIFLQQGNSRMRARDATPVIRIGALHPDSG